VSTATPKEIAAADASIGVCSAEVLAQAKHLQWIQWPAAGVDRCVQQPALHERHLLLTNLQRTMGPSMAEHVLGMMLALSRHFGLTNYSTAKAGIYGFTIALAQDVAGRGPARYAAVTS
jgi:phosphoglycerate dehydrogenase-like enzyme